MPERAYTVAELIEALRQMPQGAEVAIEITETGDYGLAIHETEIKSIDLRLRSPAVVVTLCGGIDL